MIRIVDINENNWREPLAVSKQQEGYVSNSMKLLARAYAYRNMGSYADLICEGDEDNIGSVKSIMNNGGILENEIENAKRVEINDDSHSFFLVRLAAHVS